MRTRPPSVWFVHSSLPDAVVTTGGLGFRLGRVFFMGGGGKFAAIMVPSDVREQAASGSIMLPANAIVASLRDPVIDEENPPDDS